MVGKGALLGRVAGREVGMLAGRFVGRLAGRFVGMLLGRFVGRFVGGLPAAKKLATEAGMSEGRLEGTARAWTPAERLAMLEGVAPVGRFVGAAVGRVPVGKKVAIDWGRAVGRFWGMAVLDWVSARARRMEAKERTAMAGGGMVGG